MRPRIRRRLRMIALGLVLLPTLALALLVQAIAEADREAERRDLRQRRERVRIAAEGLASRLAARGELFPEPRREHVALAEAAPPVALDGAIVVDGDCADWRSRAPLSGGPCDVEGVRFAHTELGAPEPRDLSVTIRTGVRESEGYLYVFLDVADEDVRVRRGRIDAGDQLRMLARIPWGKEAAIEARFVTTLETGGKLTTYQVGPDWRREVPPEERLGWGDYRAPAYRRPYGVWRPSERGFVVELRLPLRSLGSRWAEARLGLAVVDVDLPPGGAPLERTALWVVPQREGAWSIEAPEAEAFRRAWTERGIRLHARRVALFDTRGRELFASFDPALPEAAALRSRVPRLVDELVRSGDPFRLDPEAALAAAAIRSEDGTLLGTVVEADAGDAAPPRLLAIVGESPVLAAMLGGAVLLLFLLLRYAQRLSRRILALVDDVGADRDADDEIGELSRRLHDLVERVRADRAYLERLPAILGHETLGPLGVVKMYLDDLGTREGERDPRHTAAQRALRAIEELIADLREATSLEEALARGEPCEVDLVAFLEEYLLAYGDAKGAPIRARLPATPTPFRVALIEGRLEQLLDKLLDNAIEFSSGGPVHVLVECEAGEARIRIENPGPPLPEGPAAGQLFEPMWSQRKRTSERHLGMGLYVARVIAEHHGGSVRGWNAGEGRVVFEVRLPASRPAASGTPGALYSTR